MKIKKGFIVRQINNDYVVAAVGEQSKNFKGGFSVSDIDKDASYQFSIEELWQANSSRLPLFLDLLCADCINDGHTSYSFDRPMYRCNNREKYNQNNCHQLSPRE